MTLNPPAWVADAVFYQIFPDRFAASERVAKPGSLEAWDSPPTAHGFKGGDLLGIVEHLDYLVDLGASALYLNPVFQSASNHRYHTYDYLVVDPLLGGGDALRALVDACHARGLRVILDGVFNHAGRGFWPFHHVLETGLSSPYRDWFVLNVDQLSAGQPLRAYPNALAAAPDLGDVPEGSRSGMGSLERYGYQAWWDLPALPKLNVANPDVRAYLLNVAEHWIRFGIDGWRLDVAEELPEEFWREFRSRVKAIDPEAYIVAEIWQDRAAALEGDQFDGLMNYPFAAAVLSFVAGSHLDQRVLNQHFELAAAIRPEDGATFARRLEHLLRRYEPAAVGAQLNLLGSHDTPRVLTICGGDVASVRLAILIQMTVTGAPSVYYGDEIGMAGERDPGCRGAFPWDHPEVWNRDLHNYTRGATTFRRDHPVLRHGSFRIIAADGAAVAYLRSNAGGSEAPIVVALNAGESEARLTLELPDLEGCRMVSQRWSGWPAGTDHSQAASISSFHGVVTGGRLEVAVSARNGLVLRGDPWAST